MLSTTKLIAARLKATREALGLSQAELSQSIDCEPNRWNQYEKGKRRITLKIASALCDTHGLTLDWIYRGDPSGLPHRLHQQIRAAA